MHVCLIMFFFFSSRRRHTRLVSDWSSDVCSSDLDDGGDDAALDSRGRGAVLALSWRSAHIALRRRLSARVDALRRGRLRGLSPRYVNSGSAGRSRALETEGG